MIFNFKKNNTQKGFTLVETFVAITILLLAVLGPLGLFSKSLVDTIFAQNQITSLYLAQEGLELVINYKNNYDSGISSQDPNQLEVVIDWLGDLEDCNTCIVYLDSSNRIIVDDYTNGNDALYLNTEGKYTHEESLGSEETIFRRKVDLVPISDSSNNIFALKIKSNVIWTDKRSGLSRETNLETTLYNNNI